MSRNELDLAIMYATARVRCRFGRPRLYWNVFTLGHFLIFTNLLFYAGAWFLAWKNGVLPDRWGYFEGNRGPWRFWLGPGQTCGLLLNMALFNTLGVLAVGFYSLTRQPFWKGLVLCGAGLFLSYLFFEHYWLIG